MMKSKYFVHFAFVAGRVYYNIYASGYHDLIITSIFIE